MSIDFLVRISMEEVKEKEQGGGGEKRREELEGKEEGEAGKVRERKGRWLGVWRLIGGYWQNFLASYP